MFPLLEQARIALDGLAAHCYHVDGSPGLKHSYATRTYFICSLVFRRYTLTAWVLLAIKMAAAFGVWEVKFPSSRAVYDEDDEEDEEHSSEDDLRSLHFHRAPHLDQKPSPTECPLLVLAIGEVATTFVEAHFLSAGSEIVACITSKKTNEVDFEKLCSTYKSADTCCLHRLTTSQDDSVLCQCRTTVPQEKAFHWTEKVRTPVHELHCA